MAELNVEMDRKLLSSGIEPAQLSPTDNFQRLSDESLFSSQQQQEENERYSRLILPDVMAPNELVMPSEHKKLHYEIKLSCIANRPSQKKSTRNVKYS